MTFYLGTLPMERTNDMYHRHIFVNNHFGILVELFLHNPQSVRADITIEMDTFDDAIEMTLILYLLITSSNLPTSKYPGRTFNDVKRTNVTES